MKINNIKFSFLFIIPLLLLLTQTGFAQTNVNIQSLNSSLFPTIYTTVSVTYDGQPVNDLTKNDFEVHENSTLQTNFFEVTPPQSSGGVRLADIVFIIDCSGSMGGEIADVRNNVINFTNALADSDIDYRLGLVRFGYGNGNPYLFNSGNLTGDPDTFKGFVSSLRASGGYEPGFTSIQSAITGFNFRPGSQKIFLIITDEDSDGGNKQTTIDMLKANSITLHAAVNCNSGSSQSHYCDSTSVRGATGGLLFGVSSSYDTILNAIAEQASNTYIIRYQSSNPDLDGTERTVEITATAYSQLDSDSNTYTPGAAPIISLTAETEALEGNPPAQNSPINISANISDSVAPFVTGANIFYRTQGSTNYSRISLAKESGDTWQAEIPAHAVLYPGVDFYLTATDGNTSSTYPETDPSIRPVSIAVLPNKSPIITHTEPVVAIINQPLELEAKIFDDTHNIERASLFYRRKGEINYIEAGFSVGSTLHTIVVSIPGEYVTNDGVEYYFEAEDDLGTISQSGTPTNPHSLKAGNLVSTNFTMWVDNYSFENNTQLVDAAYENSMYKILKSEIGAIVSVPIFGDVLLAELWKMLTGYRGHCYGMSETSILYHLTPTIKPIPDKDVYEYTQDEAIDAIQNHQAGQVTPVLLGLVTSLWDKFFGTGNNKDDYDKMKSAFTDNKPVMVSLKKTGEDGGHAVVSYKMVETNDSVYAFLYDPNYPNNESNHIELDIIDQNNYDAHPYNGYDRPIVLRPWLSATSMTLDIRRMVSDVLGNLLDSLYASTLGYFGLSCPADALLTDQFGRRIGVFNGSTINEIPGAEIISEGEIEIYMIPMDLSYTVSISGTDLGEAEINIIGAVEGQNKIQQILFSQVPLTDTTKINFNFSSTDSSSLAIDQNGDGTTDILLAPQSIEQVQVELLDTDSDGIIDVVDNCPVTYNPEQTDSDNDGIGDLCEDLDEDGYTEDQGDCDDSDPTIYPRAPELCDNLDNDCNGVIDDGVIFGGFQQPINADDSSVFKAGRTIPVKIILTDCDGVSIPGQTVSISFHKIADEISGTSEELSEASGDANTDNLFRYDPTEEQYIYNLSTKEMSSGDYQITATIENGASDSVKVSLK